MALGMGIVALVIVAIGVIVAIVFAGRQADQEAAPKSEPSDFVAPVSSGGFAWRRTDESPEDFKRRVAQENAGAASGPAPDSRKA
jgi:hypothetical protein